MYRGTKLIITKKNAWSNHWTPMSSRRNRTKNFDCGILDLDLVGFLNRHYNHRFDLDLKYLVKIVGTWMTDEINFKFTIVIEVGR